jgi:Fur family ferric uptake transcriptional regulator
VTIAPERPRLRFEDTEQVAAALRAGGHRMTAAARVVLEALLAARAPVSAQAIAAGLGGRVPATDAASVYRNLERLEALGVVRHVHAGHGPGLYSLDRADTEYLVCDRCGEVTPVVSAQLDAAREEIRAALGHHARFSHFPIHGVCRRCSERG